MSVVYFDVFFKEDSPRRWMTWMRIRSDSSSAAAVCLDITNRLGFEETDIMHSSRKGVVLAGYNPGALP